MDDCKISIERDKSFWGSAIKYSIELDGFSIGILNNGGTVTTVTDLGRHTLNFISRNKIEKSLPIMLTQDKPEMVIHVRLDGSQKLEITQDYNAPDMALGSVTNSINLTSQRKKKHPILTFLGIFCVCLFVISILSIVIGDSSTDQADVNQAETVELTEEEKAENLLTSATSKFQSDDYMSAIKICEDIVSTYPSTTTAENMSSYLAERFSEYPHYSASDLMSEYDENVVNADKEYTNTAMVITGTVSSIGKTNNDSNLTVLLKSGSYFYSVQLNFKESQTDSVAALSVGDSVSAIGKCTGQSGKVLAVFDGQNVMIENCYLID